MKINCDYCGSQFDTDRYDTCPSCGAPYSRDREVIAEKEKLNQADELFMKQRELENERLRLENERLRGTPAANPQAKGCLYAGLAIFVAGLILLGLMIADMSATDEDLRGQTDGTAAKSYTVSMEPIELPEISVPSVPDIKIDIPDITIYNN
ncbi:MAG: hypothetical protein K5876_00655 [Ruminiclostridium sp.]|nr:hypothetical protein [Ruminiclostridium sp.]